MTAADFDGLPAWAGWCAMDADGAWWCYEVEPLPHDHGWYENELGRCRKVACRSTRRVDWRLSLSHLKGDSSPPSSGVSD